MSGDIKGERLWRRHRHVNVVIRRWVNFICTDCRYQMSPCRRVSDTGDWDVRLTLKRHECTAEDDVLAVEAPLRTKSGGKTWVGPGESAIDLLRWISRCSAGGEGDGQVLQFSQELCFPRQVGESTLDTRASSSERAGFGARHHCGCTEDVRGRRRQRTRGDGLYVVRANLLPLRDECGLRDERG